MVTILTQKKKKKVFCIIELPLKFVLRIFPSFQWIVTINPYTFL
jgi:hypothetical protein